MKKTLIFIGGAILGYAFNTESGKNIRNWAISKAQEKMTIIVAKINKATKPTPKPEADE